MSSLSAADLQTRLDEGLARVAAPGASVGVLVDGDVVAAASGVANIGTGEPVTTDTLFQIGSITKVWTATQVMQLVDEGLLDLDAPVADYVTGLDLGNADATKTVTARHLLAHSSGIDHAHMFDTGRGDDALAGYVATIAQAGQLWPSGTNTSYCNSGYVLLGRIIEVLRENVWDLGVHQNLVAPLGLGHTETLPERVLRHRAAIGHMLDESGTPVLPPEWGLPRGVGPAGLICSTPADVLAFAAAHLSGGGDLLSGASVDAMQAAQPLGNEAIGGGPHGLGWALSDWNGTRIVGHDGGTPWQLAYMRLAPEARVAFVLLTNGPSKALFEELCAWVFAEVAGIEMTPPVRASATPPTADELAPALGRYWSLTSAFDIAPHPDGDGLVIKAYDPAVIGPTDPLPDDVYTERLGAVDATTFLLASPYTGTHIVLTVADPDPATGRYRWGHLSGRAAPRVGDQS
jgi:CubicO group peptidase (beta-lactamase class C family)